MATPMDSDESAASLLTDIYFRDLASKLGAEWESLASRLDFRKSEIEKMKMTNRHDVNNQILDMLVKWRQTFGTLKRRHKELLVQSLKKVVRNDLAVELEEMDCQVDSTSDSDNGHTNQQKAPAGGTAEMAYTYMDQDHKVTLNIINVTGKNSPVFVGTVKNSTFNFNS